LVPENLAMPLVFRGRTSNAWVRAFVNPLITWGVVDRRDRGLCGASPTCGVAVYAVVGRRPSADGAALDIVAELSSREALTMVGAPVAVISSGAVTTAFEAQENLPMPIALMARTRNR
jgi:hypothetical protein